MKKVKLFILMLLAGTTMFVSSCSKDKNTTPTITFIGGTGYYSVNATVVAGTIIKVGINAAKGPDGANLKEYKIERIFNNNSLTVFDTTNMSTANFTFTNFMVTQQVAGSEKFKFEITDKDGNTNEIEFNITTTVPVTFGSINTWTAKLLGAQGAAAGSFLASSTGIIYDQTQTTANAASIDISYGVITPGAESFISPSERGTYGFTAFTGATITYFDVSSISTTVFDNLVNDSLIKDITTPSTKVVSNVVQNGVYKFVNAAGKKGLIKVTALTSGTSGSVTINVKVQQ
jgi:hypothetical protein